MTQRITKNNYCVLGRIIMKLEKLLIKNIIKKNKRFINAQKRIIKVDRVEWFDTTLKSSQINLLKQLPKPVLVKTRKNGMTSRGFAHQCHENVHALVNRYGGQRLVGLELFHVDSTICLNMHSVWKTPENKIVDVTKLSGFNGQTHRNDEYYFIPLAIGSKYLDLQGSDLSVQINNEEYVSLFAEFDNKLCSYNEPLIIDTGKDLYRFKQWVYCMFEFQITNTSWGYRNAIVEDHFERDVA